MKALISTLLFLGIVATGAEVVATPDPATWRREVLLGSNSDSYFVMVLHWAQAASNHTFSSGVSLERRSLATLKVLDEPRIEASSSSNIDYPQKWERVPDELPPFDIVEFMRVGRVTPAFATDFAWEVELEEGALILKERGRSVELLSKLEVQHQVPALAEETTQARVLPTAHILAADHGALTETWFYTVQVGWASWDTNWLELLIAVPGQRVHDAR